MSLFSKPRGLFILPMLLVSAALSIPSFAADPDLSRPVTPQPAPQGQAGAPSGAQAGSTGVKRVPTPTAQAQANKFPWQDSKFEDCGQSCLYGKATEMTSVQALYLTNILMAAKAASDLDGLNRIAKNFCLPGEVYQDCKKRFLFAGIISLRKMGYSINKNGEAAALLSNRKDIPGKGPVGDPMAATFERLKAAGEPDKKGQLPYIATIDDLQKEYDRARSTVTEDYHKWLDSIPREPSKDEFVKFKEIPRDPSNPAAGTFTVPEKDALGKPKIDEAKYQAAKTKYATDYAVFQKEFEQMKKMSPLLPSNMPAKLSEAITPEQRDIFFETRNYIIDKMNSDKPKITNPTQGMAGGTLGAAAPTPTATQPAARAPATGKEQIKGWKPGETRISKPGTSDSFVFAPDGIEDAIKDLEKP